MPQEQGRRLKVRAGPNFRNLLKQYKVAKHNKIMQTRIRSPAKTPFQKQKAGQFFSGQFKDQQQSSYLHGVTANRVPIKASVHSVYAIPQSVYNSE